MTDYIFTFLAATETAADESASGGISTFGLDIKVFLLQLGAIIVFYLLFRKFALNRIVAILDDRHETIKEGIENAHKAEKASREALAEQERILNQARSTADDVLSEARTEAKKLVENAAKEASHKADKILEDARSQIDTEVTKASLQLKKDMRELVALGVETVLNEKMDTNRDNKLIERALSEVS